MCSILAGTHTPVELPGNGVIADYGFGTPNPPWKVSNPRTTTFPWTLHGIDLPMKMYNHATDGPSIEADYGGYPVGPLISEISPLGKVPIYLTKHQAVLPG